LNNTTLKINIEGAVLGSFYCYSSDKVENFSGNFSNREVKK